MKNLLLLTLVLSFNSLASGVWSCKGDDLEINGGYSSAGTFTNEIILNGVALDKASYIATTTYLDQSQFLVEIYDDSRSRILLTIKTLVTQPTETEKHIKDAGEWISGGLAKIDVADPYHVSILCSGGY